MVPGAPHNRLHRNVGQNVRKCGDCLRAGGTAVAKAGTIDRAGIARSGTGYDRFDEECQPEREPQSVLLCGTGPPYGQHDAGRRRLSELSVIRSR